MASVPPASVPQDASLRCRRVGRLMGLAAGSFWSFFVLTRFGEFVGDAALWRGTVVLVPTLAVGAWLGAVLGELLARLLLERPVRPLVTIPLGVAGGAAAGAVVLVLDWLVFFGLSGRLEVVDFSDGGLGEGLAAAVWIGAEVGAMVGAWLGAAYGLFVTMQCRK